MTQKRGQVAVDFKLLEQMKEKFKMPTSFMFNSLMEKVLQIWSFYNWEWNFSNFVDTKNSIVASPDIKSIKEVKSRLPKKQVEVDAQSSFEVNEGSKVELDTKEDVWELKTNTLPKRAETAYFEYDWQKWPIRAVDWSLSLDLDNFYWKKIESLESPEMVTREIVEPIFKLKYWSNWEKWDVYTNEPNEDIQSVYNYFKLHNRKKLVELINNYVDWAARLVEQYLN